MAEALSPMDARLTAGMADRIGARRPPMTAARSWRCVVRRAFALLAICAAGLPATGHAGFDHAHAKLDALLHKHVTWIDDGHASQVDYAAIMRERDPLQSYLADVAAVSESEYATFSKTQKLAFLINAYNAYTIDFILSQYPDIQSIKDLGSLISSPWKKRLFSLLGQKRSLDDIEHGLIRQAGVFDDPRIHMAVNCASIGCPALRNEAYVAERLDAQLDDATRRFLSDASRNRADRQGLWVSKIFDWYAEDFEKQAGSVAAWLAPYAAQLSENESIRRDVRNKSLRIRYLAYDWTLNDKR